MSNIMIRSWLKIDYQKIYLAKVKQSRAHKRFCFRARSRFLQLMQKLQNQKNRESRET